MAAQGGGPARRRPLLPVRHREAGDCLGHASAIVSILAVSGKVDSAGSACAATISAVFSGATFSRKPGSNVSNSGLFKSFSGSWSVNRAAVDEGGGAHADGAGGLGSLPFETGLQSGNSPPAEPAGRRHVP